MTVALFATVIFYGFAQHICPIVRFHEKSSPYVHYDNQFLSGFLQTSSTSDENNGFLQIPFVGDPLLVYVGEKDSTQFMAYASGYHFQQRNPSLGNYKVDFTRYGIQAIVQQEPAYCIQEFTFPDTLASKGFLLDIDHALSGAQNEDMDVVFVDKRTIRAYKRSQQPDGHTPALYYVARFSHPFHQWNVRREVVRTESGQREMRCKAAFVFDLKPYEKLTVTSSVSSLSTDQAYASLNLPGAKLHFSDKRKYIPSQPISVSPSKEQPLLAQRQPTTSTTKKSSSHTGSSSQRSSAPALSSRDLHSSTKSNATSSVINFIEVTTREAELQAAFTSAISQLRHLPQCRRATNALDFLHALTSLYPSSPRSSSVDIATTDSLLRSYAQDVFTGKQVQSSSSQAAWFVLNALGLVPVPNASEPFTSSSAGSSATSSVAISSTYRIVRPLFNVATLHMPRGRRFIIHTKNNGPRNHRILSILLTHNPLSPNDSLSMEQLAKGGVLEVKMAR